MPLPHWIADEQQLRDEAVLFGLSDARPDEKIASIRLAFAVLTVPLEKQIEQGHELVGDLNLSLETAQQELTYLKQHTVLAPKPPIGWVALGLAVSMALSVGLAVGLQTVAANLPGLPTLLAGLLALSGSAGTLLLGIGTFRARLAQHQAQALTQQKNKEATLQKIAGWQAEKHQQIATLYGLEAQLAQQQATRDHRIRLFESEYDLAKSVRERKLIYET